MNFATYSRTSQRLTVDRSAGLVRPTEPLTDLIREIVNDVRQEPSRRVRLIQQSRLDMGFPGEHHVFAITVHELCRVVNKPIPAVGTWFKSDVEIDQFHPEPRDYLTGPRLHNNVTAITVSTRRHTGASNVALECYWCCAYCAT